ncbi:DUF2759 domain-containing protein [Metabacillus sp. KIGAM252]|uniref:DUF2759 domain-containing protein n=1 Tax=Metabacillus flavus TaxID=2823519 RepID=A0ABS5LG07_9BACI|nr:DUF2759 domain-containing protein [Metabacillus flavus]MBS2969680.1 DUF2759 domain-containing protein [Metabacillus flavus]
MGLVIIFSLISLLAVFGVYRAFKEKNMLGIMFCVATVGVFGWFTIMTVISHGYPTHH